MMIGSGDSKAIDKMGCSDNSVCSERMEIVENPSVPNGSTLTERTGP
jgi:hypothetical protein